MRVKWIADKETEAADKSARGQYFPALILRKNPDKTFDVEFEDGVIEQGVPLRNLQKLETEEELSEQASVNSNSQVD